MAWSEVSPTARTLRVLELLQRRPGIAAAELATSLGVSERAVRRYVEILREAGVPVEATRGRHGGYRLGRGVQQGPIVFTAEETLGLVMAVLDGRHAAADPLDPAGSALGKLIRSLPPVIAGQAQRMRTHARTATEPRLPRPDPSVTSAAVAAIAARRLVRIAYPGRGGVEREIEVEPWAVVVRHGRWYLLGHARYAGSPRVYRVDRIARVREVAEDIEPPTDLDPVAFLEEHLGRGWPLATHVVFDAPFEEVAPFLTGPMGTLEPDGPRCVLRGTTSNPAMYAGEWLAALPFPMTVVGGAELRAAVAEVGRRMLAAVAPPTG